MSTNKDYYKILGVAKGASDKEIKDAYRKLVMQHHPDKNPGNPEAANKTKEINEAYSVLKDAKSRAQYDMMGQGGGNFNRGGGNSGGGGGFGGFDFSDIFGGTAEGFDDIFANIMRGGAQGGATARASSQNLRGDDLRCDTELTLEEAFKGKKQTIRYRSYVKCGDCSGSGSKTPGQAKVTCKACSGRGSTVARQGFFTIETTCNACGGSGSSLKDPCNSCHGEGRVEKQKSVVVDIPAGIEDGSKIRVTGEGESGIRGGTNGDLYVFVKVKKHSLYTRKGDDLACEIPIKMTTAALSGTIDVPAIDGSIVKLPIPIGTQTGEQLKIAGKGMPKARTRGSLSSATSFGDLTIKVRVEVPKNLTDKQRKLLEEFEELSENSKNNPSSQGFIDKVKNFWSDIM